MSELPQVPAPRCIHLQSKAMAVYGEDFECDPDYQAGLSDMWCLKTAKSLGPDDGDVNLDDCRNRERGCYQEY
ncbi:MAG TPA: hypothetical protein VL371_23480 [Gemmataceae bacterium]|nr:hypothetical protein [Gemmataceae bacterium]